MSEEAAYSLGLSLFAGASTLLGCFIGFWLKPANKTILTLAMGFTAGVMIYISFAELLAESQVILEGQFGEKQGMLYSMLGFFGGIAATYAIDKLLPTVNPAEGESSTDHSWIRKKIFRTGILATVVIFIHNFPEGIVTIFSGMEDLTLGASIALAIAVHNIPEGLAISAPIVHATGSKRKAFLFALIAGLAEPLGALLGYYLLIDVMDTMFFGVIFAVIAGIMVFISLDQILPAADKYGRHKYTTWSIVLGMLVMAVTVYLVH